ncbi:tetratricopeptide repeat protein [Stenotrophomonas sp. YIM B06876]|uniref:tetratricopeptide repeat protein n=1 Tax=Stenotrophomonas sp. YIM B06876 TaxID=3060211 RepID=UPI00273903CB|nr:tetratricopeptide repeat protein [Stenotrophomonas sp. YIM B06876]
MKNISRKAWLGALLMVCVFGFAAGGWVLLHPASFAVQPWRAQESITATRFVFGPYPMEQDMQRLHDQGVTTIISLLNPALPYESVLLKDERKRAGKFGIVVQNFPMGSILGQRFGVDYERNSKAAAEAAMASHGPVYIHCYLGLHRAADVRDYLQKYAPTREFDGDLAHHRNPRQLANERAFALFKHGQYDAAAQMLNSVQPLDYAAHVQHGWIHLRRDENQQARNEFSQAIALGNPKMDAWDGQGFAALRLGELPAAEAAFSNALALDAQDGDARQGLAQVFYRRGDAAKAKPLLEALHKQNPDNSEVGQLLQHVNAMLE